MKTHLLRYGLLMTSLALPVELSAQSQAPEWGKQKISVDFAGGTIETFVETLREQVPDMNVVVAEEVKDLPVQPLRLNNVVIPAVLETLEELLRPQIDIGPVGGGRDADQTPVLLIRRDTSRRQTAAFGTKRMPKENVGNELMQSIEFAIESLPNADHRVPPNVRVHGGSGIVIVTADQDQLRLISQVIVLLGGESRVTFGSMAPGYPGDMYGMEAYGGGEYEEMGSGYESDEGGYAGEISRRGRR